MNPAQRAIYENAPETVFVEHIDSSLIVNPRPTFANNNVGFNICATLREQFSAQWVLLFEHEIHIDDEIVVPDVCAYRRATFKPVMTKYVEQVPDWVCEVLSESTERYDRTTKWEFYQRVGVEYLWFVDGARKAVEVYRRGAVQTWKVRGYDPFDGPIDVERFWQEP